MSSSSIPDGFSTEQLEELLKTAKANTTVTPGDPNISNIIYRVTETTDNLVEELGSMEIYKFIADYCLYQIIGMHKEGFNTCLDSNDRVSALQWSDDLGRLNNAYAVLRSVYMGSNDFMHPSNDDDCDECDS